MHAGVSQLYDRLGDMEAAMRELAQAQATSSSVLTELGGRFGPQAGAAGAALGAGPGWPQAQAGTGSSPRELLFQACAALRCLGTWPLLPAAFH